MSTMAMKKNKIIKEPPTYEGEVLAVLAYEFSFLDHTDSERKIKRRLREKKLGPYDQNRIEIIRKFKDDVQEELGKSTKSKFWNSFHGEYVDMQDWNLNALKNYFEKRNPNVSKQAIDRFLKYAIYLYYLR